MSEVRTAHLLIKHTGSRNPISRRTNQKVNQSPQEALDELKKYQVYLRKRGPSSEDFAQTASERSDCSSYKNGGDLGYFGRGQMQRPFEEASFSLAVNTMSEIVSTDSGYHLIYRID
uniref:Peptidyl-prolyl cis-trans isomerase n=1 Tax=Corethron hystrix TaxID=216773 RepID=A0A7S1BAZ9_9STRA|mmetsp:Transcript_18840/g.42978  ORF Transcript_18840/g.42978 Transcript_18840/m.42978 type:complete len:117 (+) Transcript_18840:266-616(+)